MKRFVYELYAWYIMGIPMSIFVTLVVLRVYENAIMNNDGLITGYFTEGYVMFTQFFIAWTVFICLNTKHWTIHLTVLYAVFTLVYLLISWINEIFPTMGAYMIITRDIWGNGIFWLTTLFISGSIGIFYYFIRQVYFLILHSYLFAKV